MYFLTYLYYPLLAFLLLFQGKLFKRGEWNEEFLSLKQTKALQGFAAVCIMFHHMAQKTCAFWLPPKYIVHGLDFFVPIGYLFVAIFFFFSGFGLLKSYKSKENYLQGFLPKRISPLFVASVLIGFIFLVARSWMRDHAFIPMLNFTFGEPQLLNPNGWFPITISVLYIGFYLSYRFCKNKKVSLYLTCLVALLYIFYCDFMIYGTWWYNSVPAFCAGLFMAEYEKQIVDWFKKHYIPSLIILFVLNVVLISFSAQHTHSFNRFVPLLSQMLSSITFVLLLLVAGMKIQIGNKALAFLGSMTLELYLIHGLFVHLFGYCFIAENVDSLYYIETVPLYVLVVLVLSIPSAFLLKIIDDFIIRFFKKRRDVAKSLNKDVLKILVGLVVILVIVIFVQHHIAKKDTEERNATIIPEYIEENITFADVGGKKMAADISGQGKHTIVIISPIAPTLTLKELANHINDDFRIVLLDPLGTGFSDSPDTPRTIPNIVEELHTGIHALGIDQPFVLLAHQDCGLYSLAYANAYPQDLEEIIDFDGYVFDQFKQFLRSNDLNEKSYNRMNTRSSQIHLLFQKMLTKTGLVRFQWPIYEPLFSTENNQDRMPILEEGLKSCFYNDTSFDTDMHTYENFFYVKDMKYPEEIPVIEFIGFETWQGEYFSDDWLEQHKQLLNNHPLSKTSALAGDVFSIYWDMRMFRQQITGAVNLLDK